MERVIFYYWTIFLIIGSGKYGQCDISCYSCSTLRDAPCKDPESNKLETRKCNKEAMMEMKKFAECIDERYSKRFDVVVHTSESLPLRCMKLVTTVDGKQYTIRGCQLDSGQPDICKVVIDESKQQGIGNVSHCSLCNIDGCNLATKFGSAKIFPVLAVVLVQTATYFYN